VAKGQGGFGPDPDDFVLMPLGAFQGRLAGNSQVSSILVTVGESTAIPSVTATITSILRARRHLLAAQANDFQVQDMKEIQQTVGSVTLVLTALLGSVGAVSLLVGGIGIMNIMLVSVTERTREIGIRLAIGAGRNDVLLQFLAEAVVLSLLGGLVGVGLGLGGAWGATKVLALPFEVMPSVVALACGFSVVVGVGFGYLPARRAAQLNPIEALRHE
jgi:putative ABC transport system permease protein